MNMCANHPEKEAVAYCRMCGKPLCSLCRVERFGAVYCAEDAPPLASTAASAGATPFTPSATPPAAPYVPIPGEAAAQSPYTVPVGHGSPWLALVLGCIPGVGAIYNGQYAKGLIHAVIFGLLITVVSNCSQWMAPMVGILIAVWFFYMVLEAYHTARRRRLGLPVDELSSLVNLRSHRTGLPIGSIVLIGAGLLLLLDSTGMIPMNLLLRYWPVALILLGVYMLYTRLERRAEPDSEPIARRELSNERR